MAETDFNSDVGNTTIAYTRWTGLLPMEDSARECDAPNRGSSVMGITITEAFAQDDPNTS